MAQATGTSASTQGLLAGQPGVSLPAQGQAAVSIGQPFALPGSTSGHDLTWDLQISGTAPATLEVDLEGALDQAFAVATQNPGAASGAQLDTYTGVVSTMRHVTNKQVNFVRLNIITLTGGDGTTRIMGRIFCAKRGSGL